MPCYDHRDSPSEIRGGYEKKINQYAAWMCTMLDALEKMNIHPKDPELKKWWEEHKAWDKARKEAEANAKIEAAAREACIQQLLDLHEKLKPDHQYFLRAAKELKKAKP